MTENKRSKKAQSDFFTRFATTVSEWVGHPWVFAGALAFLILWALSGPLLHFSDTWQLIVNTSTTIITFLIVFIIQNTQNRDSMAMNVKLDVLMKKLGVQDDEFMRVEDESEARLKIEKTKAQDL